MHEQRHTGKCFLGPERRAWEGRAASGALGGSPGERGTVLEDKCRCSQQLGIVPAELTGFNGLAEEVE